MKKFIILAGIVTAMLFCALIYIVIGEDKTAPVIMQENQNLVYKDGEDENLLLNGIKAEDDVDGDVTSSIMIGDIVTMPDKEAAKITYLAKDTSNNVGVLDIVIPFEASTANNSKTEAATLKTADEQQELNQQQEKAEDKIPVISLTTTEAELKTGEDFHPEKYIKDIKDDKDSIQTLLQNITVTGDYDTAKSGTYVLLITTRDSDDNKSEGATLVLKVKP
ncbi:hypothetical protein [Anaerocolumna chitinilytica]|uniref:Pesticidal crystal protein Cry22Aa Ig-like domain-containing protein n=1 Tax=Anaerocolumna chitinilytica TaxID=1727145 RepID=A0A7I8DK44_9FIRM|nr:hypothetical protein [Anaerocolumna chitinilytica]BCJ97375.1 hypothetical protein bsdcttw_04160 [Anaerocolumna chitinilytica]